ncbi:GNAT family N-acetyltransferase [Tetragenococcus koreensis]|uniref:GNAT family N-acetyltransferase n=1 Tax=Tetragenococcus koreensis TaxID=290335 RepID=UPI000F4E1965|nr:GNAT family N-acetyltransferase [Tetragenococcus koreensis]MDN5808804.1 GNAT family N-acetyltransferase [Staphylococcus equorum]MDN6398736.1 GNAT family N-acetyltransferase [Alkalibacterium sp.]AYW45498.1 GNAT family N-acetyltransferase [Tetragenococcus koreensis]MCF1585700.1 GNAT family N-acetyltransferase [Tetragenococcus koreensis]MCF1615333.1 GNAT family N-acetyltransferase [Tetragenococcus koreensis]
MLTNKTATKQDEQQIIELWDRSVTATHDFLKQEDKNQIREEIPSYFPFLDIHLWYDGGNLLAFSGQNENHLEMLFIDPQFTAKGYGTAILQELITRYGITSVDVNEQNTVAEKFYLKNGFHISARSQTDDQNRPYPILHLSNI